MNAPIAEVLYCTVGKVYMGVDAVPPHARRASEARYLVGSCGYFIPAPCQMDQGSVCGGIAWILPASVSREGQRRFNTATKSETETETEPGVFALFRRCLAGERMTAENE